MLGAVRRDGNTAPFLDGAARGEFLLRRCRVCSNVGAPQEGQCPACGSSETEWVPASGGGPRRELVGGFAARPPRASPPHPR